MAADGIPSFRLDDTSIQRDIQDILALGVNIHCGEAIDRNGFDELRGSHDFIFIAVRREYPPGSSPPEAGKGKEHA